MINAKDAYLKSVEADFRYTEITKKIDNAICEGKFEIQINSNEVNEKLLARLIDLDYKCSIRNYSDVEVIVISWDRW